MKPSDLSLFSILAPQLLLSFPCDLLPSRRKLYVKKAVQCPFPKLLFWTRMGPQQDKGPMQRECWGFMDRGEVQSPPAAEAPRAAARGGLPPLRAQEVRWREVTVPWGVADWSMERILGCCRPQCWPLLSPTVAFTQHSGGETLHLVSWERASCKGPPSPRWLDRLWDMPLSALVKARCRLSKVPFLASSVTSWTILPSLMSGNKRLSLNLWLTSLLALEAWTLSPTSAWACKQSLQSTGWTQSDHSLISSPPGPGPPRPTPGLSFPIYTLRFHCASPRGCLWIYGHDTLPISLVPLLTKSGTFCYLPRHSTKQEGSVEETPWPLSPGAPIACNPQEACRRSPLGNVRSEEGGGGAGWAGQGRRAPTLASVLTSV